MPNQHISRRHIIATFGAVTGGVLVGLATPSTAAQATPARTTQWAKHTTQNRWPVIDPNTTISCPIEGSNAAVTLVSDAAVRIVLLHVARRFHYEIAGLHRGDVLGHTTDTNVTAAYESNYLSGTAFAIRSRHYPTGSSGNLYPAEIIILRDILADCEGVVRWGGDDKNHPKEGHFQIDVPPGDKRLKYIAATIQTWQTKPDHGAGTFIDPLTPDRRSAAINLERRQRR